MLSIACVIAAGCSNPHASSPIAPTVATTPAPVPAPASSFTLRGRVGEAPPTAPTGIRGAVLTIGDGVNAGRSAVTDAYGFYTIPDNAGPIDATLTWNPTGTAKLDLTLFQTGNPTPIVRSAGGSKEERVIANLTIPSTYELRITYAGGTADATYTLKVTHLN